MPFVSPYRCVVDVSALSCVVLLCLCVPLSQAKAESPGNRWDLPRPDKRDAGPDFPRKDTGPKEKYEDEHPIEFFSGEPHREQPDRFDGSTDKKPSPPDTVIFPDTVARPDNPAATPDSIAPTPDTVAQGPGDEWICEVHHIDDVHPRPDQKTTTGDKAAIDRGAKNSKPDKGSAGSTAPEQGIGCQLSQPTGSRHGLFLFGFVCFLFWIGRRKSTK